jgi:hypothetical protein
MAATKLTLDDIADLRAYERERDQFRERIIALKRIRRVQLGPHVTLVFENRDTVRFQIQEMARAERMLTDEAILGELEAYNPLIPGPGELSATLFVELATRAELEEWLPKLVGIERAVHLELGGPGDGPASVIPPTVDEDHAARLTREEVTASVHYVRFSLPGHAVDRFATASVELVADHPEYRHRTRLGEATKASLLADLRPAHS